MYPQMELRLSWLANAKISFARRQALRTRTQSSKCGTPPRKHRPSGANSFPSSMVHQQWTMTMCKLSHLAKGQTLRWPQFLTSTAFSSRSLCSMPRRVLSLHPSHAPPSVAGASMEEALGHQSFSKARTARYCLPVL